MTRSTRTRTLLGGFMVLALASSYPEVKDLPERKEMPDPLVSESGQRVTTRGQWTHRRDEMKRMLEHYMLGRMPPPPGNVKGNELDARTVSQGKVQYTHVHLAFGPDARLGFDIAVFRPAQGKGPFPTIVQPSFFPTPGSPPPPAPAPAAPGASAATTAPTEAEQRAERMRATAVKMSDPENAATLYTDALDRGYAIATFNYQQCGLDKAEYRESGFFPAYADYDWADLAAWAWCMSRTADYLEHQPFADHKKLIALGHSRLGKATLVAGAFDERFALVAPAGSGCGGTGAFRFNGEGRGGKEGLERAVAVFPQWFCARFAQFSGHVYQLPFDQHWLIALVAPRAFIAADGLDDQATNGMALKHAYLAARPVYELLGVPAREGVHFRPGQHALAPEDWRAVLDFADQQLRGMTIAQRFDQFPPDDQLH